MGEITLVVDTPWCIPVIAEADPGPRAAPPLLSLEELLRTTTASWPLTPQSAPIRIWLTPLPCSSPITVRSSSSATSGAPYRLTCTASTPSPRASSRPSSASWPAMGSCPSMPRWRRAGDVGPAAQGLQALSRPVRARRPPEAHRHHGRAGAHRPVADAHRARTRGFHRERPRNRRLPVRARRVRGDDEPDDRTAA